MPFLWHSQGWWSCASGEERGMEDRRAVSPRQNMRGLAWSPFLSCLPPGLGRDHKASQAGSSKAP